MKEWMELDVTDIPKATGQCDDVYVAYEKGHIAGAKAALEHIQKKNAKSENFSGSINRLIHQMLKELEE